MAIISVDGLVGRHHEHANRNKARVQRVGNDAARLESQDPPSSRTSSGRSTLTTSSVRYARVTRSDIASDSASNTPVDEIVTRSPSRTMHKAPATHPLAAQRSASAASTSGVSSMCDDSVVANRRATCAMVLTPTAPRRDD